MAGNLLTDDEIGHLRHFDNLSRLSSNDWSGMQGKCIGQDDFGGYRFQLSYMIYALALTHRNRLPAAPGLFQPTIQRLIDKLLSPEVWMYWRDTGRGGAMFNAHVSDQLQETWDPVVKDNIMYSAYVQSCSLLHDYLFKSDRYAAEGSLTFAHWSYFWGGEPKRFAYDRNSLNEHIYWQMVRNGYLGVACEPNCVFQICNQPAILGFRLHDLITGGSRTDEVLAGYERAWADFGRLDEHGHYHAYVTENPRQAQPNHARSAWVDAWAGAMMNMWNRDFVREHYPRQVRSLLVEEPGGSLAVRPTPHQVGGIEMNYDFCDFGWTTFWTSEMGDHETRDRLLEHADTYMSPTRRLGGLYYPRQDTVYDAEGHLTEMEPLTGNVLLGLARLNVPDGLWRLFNEPLAESHFEEPALTGVDRDVDISRAETADGGLIVAMARRDDVPGGGSVTIGRTLGRGRWRLDVDDEATAVLEGGTVTRAGGPTEVEVAAGDAGLIVRPSTATRTFRLVAER